MSRFFESGFIDTFRHFYPDDKHHYSWWSQRANSRNNNKGWRIDYHAVTNNMKEQLLEAGILPDVKHSDHCPVYLKIKL
jgi:exodeoxyribonuclease-3